MMRAAMIHAERTLWLLPLTVLVWPLMALGGAAAFVGDAIERRRARQKRALRRA